MSSLFLLLVIIGLNLFHNACFQVQICTNKQPDAVCDALAAQGMCLLNPAYTNCQCPKSCFAPPDCSLSGNLDMYCDCISTAFACDISPTLAATCPTTCSYRAGAECPKPAVKKVLFSAQGPYRYGDIINMTCLPGYSRVSGSKGTRVCGVDGQWVISPIDGVAPICQATESKSCTTPAKVPYAMPSQPITSPGKSLTYTCQEKSVKIGGGLGTQICQNDGTFLSVDHDTSPMCRATEVKYRKGPIGYLNHPDLTKLTMRSSVECSLMCLYNYHCIGYSYKHGECSLNNNGITYPSTITTYNKLS